MRPPEKQRPLIPPGHLQEISAKDGVPQYRKGQGRQLTESLFNPLPPPSSGGSITQCWRKESHFQEAHG